MSLRSTRRAAPRPSRVKGVFESLLSALNEGTDAVKNSVETLKSQLPAKDASQSRVNYYLEQEKHIKALERKIRTLEVHRDRVEELRDDYTLKVKLKDGAFNLGEALANQPSKGAKEKLQEVRGEQKELVEDLCDIEEELETKLGVFTIHINGLVGLNHPSNGEQYEVQLQLASQKWKARCKISRQQQLWQDANIVFLGKIMDEMFVKIVEVRRIHGNTHMGSMKCHTRELFSFFPLNVTFNFSNASQAKLSMNVTWSPMLGEDFLSDLKLHTIHCLVGPQATEPLGNRTSFYANVERLHMVPGSDAILNDTGQKIQKLKIIPEPEEVPPVSPGLPKAEKPQSKKKTSKDMDEEFVFYDKDVLAASSSSSSLGTHLLSTPQSQKAPPVAKSSSSSNNENGGEVVHKVSSSSLYSTGTQGSSSVGGATRGGSPTPELLSLGATVENLLGTLEEAKQTFFQLKELAAQLARLDEALKGGKLTKAPSMTFSENMVMESFDFLDSDDPKGKASFGQYSESGLSSVSESKEEQTIGSLPSYGAHSQASVDSGTEEAFMEMQVTGKDTVGIKCIDRAVLQHLVYCDHLLQNLHSSGPLKYRLTSSLKKLQQEAGVIAELLNLAADPSGLQRIEQMLPELAAHDQLLNFWKLVARDNLLCVSCEQFAITLDNKFGETIWTEFPDIANKVFSEFLARIIDLDGDNSEQLDTMVVTVFQYSAYFTEHGSTSILKVMRDIAQELKVTEGLLLSDGGQARGKIAQLLEGYAYNRGALLASLYLLVDKNERLQLVGAGYVQKFCGHSPWHSKAVQYFIEQLEHTDQTVRCGACIALGKLEAKPAIEQLKHIALNDFSSVRDAARKALETLGEPITPVHAPAAQGAKSDLKDKASFSPVRLDGPAHSHRHTALQRTRSAEAT